MSEEDFFDQFMRTSELNSYSVRDFAERLNTYDHDALNNRKLVYPEVTTPFPRTASKLDKIAQKRESSRSFNGDDLTLKQVASVLQSLRAWHGLDHRAYPAAGSLYSTETFCVLFRVADMSGGVIYYDAETHGYVELSSADMMWEKVQDKLNIEVQGIPQALVLFVHYPKRQQGKYGERGGRFGLLEAGAMMQQISLAVAECNLHGVVVGGTFDDYWRMTLGLDDDARVILGYLLGR